jgi:replicative DNA helicase
MAPNVEDSSIVALLARDILAVLLKDRTSMERYGFLLADDHFQNPIHRVLFGSARVYFEKYGQLPRRDVLSKILLGKIESASFGYVPTDMIWREVEEVFKAEDLPREFVGEKIDEWLVRKALISISEKAERMSRRPEPNLDDIRKDLKKIDEFRSGTADLGAFVFRDMLRRRRDEDVAEPLPTGIRDLDKVLGGGLNRGTLGVLFGPAGYGKSNVMIVFGVNAARARYRVLHITLELSQKAVLRRYESAFSKISKVDISGCEERLKKKLSRLGTLVKPADVLVKEFSSRGLTFDALRAFVANILFWEDFKPDLVLLDYADIMRLPKGNDERWVKEGELFSDLRGLAQEQDIALWTAAQAKKTTFSKAKLRMDDLAGAVEKAQIADVILALCRTEEEKIERTGRFFVAKNRDNIDDVTIYFRERFEQSRVESVRGSAVRTVTGRPDGERSDIR